MGVPTRVTRARPHGRRWKKRSASSRVALLQRFRRASVRQQRSSKHCRRAARWLVQPLATPGHAVCCTSEQKRAGSFSPKSIPPDTDATLVAAKDASLLWLESPSNPLIEITELDRILPTLRSEQVKIAVDSTFATPLLQ